jgi:heme/copper-type cytochrome/quinol oxidase subunit 2
MPAPYSDILFWAAIVATLVAQIFILRSTARGMQTGVVQTQGRTAREWMWAILPAISLVVLFVWTWRTIHPPTPRIPAAEVTTLTFGAPAQE